MSQHMSEAKRFDEAARAAVGMGERPRISLGGPATAQLNPLNDQVGGDHYKDLKIQPVEYIHANNIGFMEGAVVKYVTRWRAKGGLADLRKAKHMIELLIELEGLS